MQGLLGCYGSKGWGSLSTGARAGGEASWGISRGVADLDWSPGGCGLSLPCPAARLKKVTPGRGPGKGSGRGTTYCGPTDGCFIGWR